MSRLLTDAELELMQVLWSRGGSSAREVLGELPDGRAYTTVSTILRILVDKGFVGATPRGRAHEYRPLLTRNEYRMRKLTSVVDGLFDGSALDLVRHLVSSETLDKDELDGLKAMVEDLDE